MRDSVIAFDLHARGAGVECTAGQYNNPQREGEEPQMKRSHLSGFLVSLVATCLCVFALHAQPDPASPWPMFHGDVRHTGQSDTLSAQSGKLLWSYVTGDDVRSSACSKADGTIYFGSDKEDKNVYAISFSGERLWSYTTGDAIQGTCALSSNGNIYIGSHDNSFYALTTAGILVWSYETGDVNDAPPVEGADGKVYFGSNNDRLYALRSEGSLNWSYVTDGDIWGGAAIGAGGEVVVGSLDKHLYALRSTGSLRWSYNVSEAIKAGVAIDTDGTIYGGTSSITTYLFSINSDGSLRWIQSGEDFYSTPAISSSGTIYIGSDDNNLYAYNSDSTLNWSYSTGDRIHDGTAAIGSDGTVYASSTDNYCYALNAPGSIKWSYAIGSSECAPSIGAYGTLYVGSNDNAMYAFEGLPTPTPTPTDAPTPTATPVPLIDLRPNKNVFSAASDNITILADVTQAINTPFYPVFYFELPSGPRLYIALAGKKIILTTTPSAYTQRKHKKRYVPVAITVPGPASNIPLFSASFGNIAPGDYILKGGALDAQAPIVNGEFNWLPNGLDTETLRMQ